MKLKVRFKRRVDRYPRTIANKGDCAEVVEFSHDGMDVELLVVKHDDSTGETEEDWQHCTWVDDDLLDLDHDVEFYVEPSKKDMEVR